MLRGSVYSTSTSGEDWVYLTKMRSHLCLRTLQEISSPRILPVIRKQRSAVLYDVVGPICESGDFLAKERELKEVKRGEYLAVMGAGAYGFFRSSNYNCRPKAAEVMVKDREHFLIRERETYNDLLRSEKIPSFLK